MHRSWRGSQSGFPLLNPTMETLTLLSPGAPFEPVKGAVDEIGRFRPDRAGFTPERLKLHFGGRRRQRSLRAALGASGGPDRTRAVWRIFNFITWLKFFVTIQDDFLMMMRRSSESLHT
jgi:hypothetical protein